MKKLLLISTTLLLTACAHTSTGTPEASTIEQQIADQQPVEQAPVDPAIVAYQEALPGITADANAVFPQLNAPIPEEEAEVKVNTTKGSLVIRLFPKLAPLAVENFLTQAKEGQYDGVALNAAGENYVLQSGYSKRYSSIWKDVDPNIDPGTGFATETTPYLYNLRGAVSMFNSGPNTSTSAFFINSNNFDMSGSLSFNPKIIEAYKTGGNPGLDGYYAVFGQVSAGLEVLDAIEAAGKAGETVTISNIEIIRDYTFQR